ncbi:PREDICTED: cysteine-rich repeat secretory protein 3 [Fragaria vesca subsp. vesca]|uniref:cysteine-rich repeat secretory protein 3 n=1 Tax=Fragaria vesca subsp. vesca TaxID=101020 RepID=UPI0002C372B8|nr:PREDICTED: cysteine-rich repeat secretory protein 3 [Fragaria vesca subsp. vesca]
MDSTSAVFLCFVALFLSSVISISDHSSLVYKNCANQTFTTTAPTNPHTQTLTSLFQELTAHSNRSKFFKHTESSTDDDKISGVYQCREDITNQECHSCVSTIPVMSNTVCRESVAARVQLRGCYMHYKLEGIDHLDYSSKERLLHKSCGQGGGSINGGLGGFEEMRRAAFGVLESGVVSGEGFCKTRYELVDVMAQCEGGLGGCECGECVSGAVQIAEEECGGSVSGEIYLAECFLSFAYHPDDESHPEEDRRDRKGSNGKTLAIVVGGAAALFFGFIFLLFLKSWGKKDEY